MSKLNSLFKTIQSIQMILAALRASGIDIDKIIAVSNAQGPQARVIQDLISQAVESESMDLKGLEFQNLTVSVPRRRQLSSPPKKRSKKNKELV
jgi:ABC-type metal ion transport system substrate-binding protein